MIRKSLGFAVAIGVAAGSVLALRSADAVTPPVVEGGQIRVEILIDPRRKDPTISLAETRKAIPVAILGSPAFPMADIDRETIRFAGAEPRSMRPQSTDVNQDRRADQVWDFVIGDLKLEPGATQACMTGKMVTGMEWTACAPVTVTP
jgi:hypothetical protein